MAAIAGIGIGLIGLVAGGAVLLFAGGNLSGNFTLDAPELNAFGIGIPAIALGPTAYFLGKASQTGSAAVLGIAATVFGAASTLLWLVIMLLGFFGPPPP